MIAASQGHAPDRDIVRKLAQQVMEIAAEPVQDERRALWRDLHSLRGRTPVVYVSMWTAQREYLRTTLECADPFYRGIEASLRAAIFRHWVGDDAIIEPWIDVESVKVVHGTSAWGPDRQMLHSDTKDGAYQMQALIDGPEDMHKLIKPKHVIDEAATRKLVDRVSEAVGDIIEVNLSRAPLWREWYNDISTCLGWLRGMEGLMWDMVDRPEWLHELLAFMRDGMLDVQAEAEAAGDWGLTDQLNQAETYSHELPDPRANSRPVTRKSLWGWLAGQEYTTVSPEMQDEFLLRYQIPIAEKYGLVHYGCCDDLTRKIDMLRKVPNLRRIAVAPRADVERCAEQIGHDYVASWRPNPAETVCCGFDEEHIRGMVRSAKASFDRHSVAYEVNLKEIETIEGEPERLRSFARIVKEELGR